jgi:putative ABC transport system permease protein
MRAASLDDLGLRLIVHEEPGYLALESTRMVLRETDSEGAKNAAAAIGARFTPTLTYLANSIEVGERSLSYSTVSALDVAAEPPLGPLLLEDGSPAPPLGPGEIYLNTWAARELQAEPGDAVRLTYYLSGPTGEFREDGEATFELRGVVAMSGVGADAGLTPEYPGIHDARSIRDWDPPFPIDLRRVGERDERYWEDYKALPKAFVGAEEGARLWTSRFGKYTALRIAPAGDLDLAATAEALAAELHRHIIPEFSGLIFSPVKDQGLQASGGASDFGLLFIGFSFFIIIAAMLLVRLMFTLGVEQRAKEIGILIAVGYAPRQVRRLFLAEGAVLAVLGAGLGAGGGLGFAALMLHGLRTWWNASVGTTFLFMHVEAATLGLGAFIGLAVGLLSVFLAVRRLASTDPLTLVSGQRDAASSLAPRAGEERMKKLEEGMAVVGVLVAAVCMAASSGVSAGLQAALFYGAGVGLLTASLALLSSRLRSTSGDGSLVSGGWPIVRLGARNAARHRGRSLLTVGLMSSATFVIVTVSAMRQDASHASIELRSGNGGFALMAESDIPILHDLNEPDGRFDLSIQTETEALMEGVNVFSLRLNPGEDASCLNLYRPGQPRVLGAPQNFIERGGFLFQGVMDTGGGRPENPWALLNAELPDGSVPVIGDYNTVQWILHSGLGKTFEIRDGADQPVRLTFVALLKGSALQGELIVSEENFIELFPERGGSEFFFIEAPAETVEPLHALLERDLRPYGLDVTSTQARIQSYHAVENTFLSTFQILGGLGLLLGTLGLTAVVLRGILERRGELALMACVGYSDRALSALVLAENFLLLIGGLGIGFASALLASAPAWLQAGSGPHLGSLLLTLAAVLATGLCSGLAGVRALSRLPLLDSLKAP